MDQKLWEDKINPQVWDQGIPGRAHQAELVIIVLRNPTRFPNQKQYPLRREAREGLQLLVTTEEPITPSPIGKDQKLWENKINPQVWDLGILEPAHQDEPVIIVLQDPTRFPNQKQYPLQREAWEGLQPLINKFLTCGLSVPTNLLCNTPILSVKKKDGTW